MHVDVSVNAALYVSFFAAIFYHCITLLIYFRTLDQIPPSLLPHFKEAARELMKEKGAEDALAAALAHISGSKEIVSRSVLSGMSVSILHIT